MQDAADGEQVLTVKEMRKIHIRNLIFDGVLFVTVFLIVILFFRHYQFPQISGESMAPTFHDSDRVIARVTTEANVGDVVVAWSDTLNEYIVKRVIGISGDHIVIDNGRLYRNGTRIYEDYIAEQNWGEAGIVYDVTVPDGHVFLLGDNRNQSTDSRVLGVISCEDIHMQVISKANWVEKLS